MPAGICWKEPVGGSPFCSEAYVWKASTLLRSSLTSAAAWAFSRARIHAGTAIPTITAMIPTTIINSTKVKALFLDEAIFMALRGLVEMKAEIFRRAIGGLVQIRVRAKLLVELVEDLDRLLAVRHRQRPHRGKAVDRAEPGFHRPLGEHHQGDIGKKARNADKGVMPRAGVAREGFG